MRLVSRSSFLFIALVFAFCFSCNKKIDALVDMRTDTKGEWIFMSNAVSSETIKTYTIDGVSYKNKWQADYVTYNNEGSVVVSEDGIAGIGLRYDVITSRYFTFYAGDDEDEDSVEWPFTYYMDSAYDAQKKYQMVGVDSIYFPNGIVMWLPDIDSRDQISMDLPQGGTIKRFDNSMLITTSSKHEYDYTEDDITFHVVQKETVGISLERPH